MSTSFATLPAPTNTVNANNFIWISTNKIKKGIRVTDIAYIKAEGSYCSICLYDGTRHLVSKTLKKLFECLPKRDFRRCHQSYAVCGKYITRITDDENIEINTAQGTRIIPISRRRKRSFFNTLKSCPEYI